MAAEEVKITFTIDGIEKEVKSVEELQKEMKNLGKETKKVAEENSILAKGKKAFADMKAGIKGATAGFKGLKGAIAATGLGALLIILTSLFSYFKNSEEGSRKLAIAMEALGIITGKVMDFFAMLGEKIMWAFTSPKEALMSFADAIKENIMNRFEGLLELIPALGSAIKELFSGNFSEAGKIAADAVGKVVLGVEDITEKVGDAIEATVEFGKTVVAEVKEAVEVAGKLVDQFRGIRDAQQKLIVDNALLNKEMETQQKIAEDTNRTYEERKEALEKVGEAQVKLAENLAEQARLEEENLRLQISQECNYDKIEELETSLAEAIATRIDAETALETRRLDAQKITAELENEEIARKQTIRDKLAEMELEDVENEFAKAQAELELAQQKDLEELDRLKATEEEKQKVREFYDGKSKKLNKEKAKFDELLQKQVTENNLQLAASAFSAIANLIGQDSAAGKAAAISAATISTYLGAQKAYTSQMTLTPDSPIRAALAAGVAVATGLANVKAIVATKTPGGGSAGGGSTPSTPSIPTFDPTEAIAAAAGDTDIDNTVGPESVASGGGTAGVIKAYVVAEDMTSQQEADAKINDLARL